MVTVAICAATGNQGKEIIKRFREINEMQIYGAGKNFYIKTLTRNASSDAALKLSQNTPNLTVIETVYSSRESLENALRGVDALFLNYALVKNEAEIEKLIIDVAIKTGVRHIIYSTVAACENDYGVPHWESSRQTNEYLRECLAAKQSEGCPDDAFRFHLVQLAHFNENILPGSYFPPKNGSITYPWRSDAQFATSSLRDAARVACKLFTDPTLLANGAAICAITEFVTVNKIASAVSDARGETIRPAKGPWVFTTFGHCFGWEASSILHMSKHIDKYEFMEGVSTVEMGKFLREEIKTEPLETMTQFAKRHFAAAGNSHLKILP